MISSIDHINIVVDNLEESVSFYTELLGMKVTRRAHLEGDWIESVVGLTGVSADVVYVQPVDGGPRIELIHYLAPEGKGVPETSLPNTAGLRHMAFRVEGIDEICDRLRKAGVKIIGAPVTVPAGVVKHDAGRKSLCYFYDPDGVLLELAEYS